MTKKIWFKNLITKLENSEIGKKVLTDGLDLSLCVLILTDWILSRSKNGLSFVISEFLVKPIWKKMPLHQNSNNHKLTAKIIKYSDLPNNRAANLIIFRGNKHLNNLIRTYTFINFWDFSFKTWFSPI